MIRDRPATAARLAQHIELASISQEAADRTDRTMTALVIGLLIATAASSYVTRRGDFTQMSTNLVRLDRELAHYGPDTKEVRDLLRRAVARELQADLVRTR
jgi:hypothetical protein